jgi:hypothetical protein
MTGKARDLDMAQAPLPVEKRPLELQVLGQDDIVAEADAAGEAQSLR